MKEVKDERGRCVHLLREGEGGLGKTREFPLLLHFEGEWFSKVF